ncbi:MAG: carbohydrate kinase family protein [Candidatus Harrisonbacteria bacterium]|nr:carbohydrate kinase family protein [Candidatus Harrisonbacteria bacterium]
MYDVITIGTATRDVFLQSPAFKPVKDPHFTSVAGFPSGEAECFALGKKIEIAAPVFTTGGGSTNSAVTFARQGFQTAAVISLGKDETSKDVLADLKREHIKPLVGYAKDLHTAYSTILLSETGERTILVYRGAADYLGRVALPKLHAKAVYIAPGAIPVERMQRFVDHFHAQGALIAMNPSGYYVKLGVQAMRPILEKLDVVIVNREEAATMTGKPFEDEKAIFKAFDEVVPGIAVMTDGPRGVTVSDGKTLYKSGIFSEQKLIDRTGAGDAFGSGFVAGLLRAERLGFSVQGLENNSSATNRYTLDAIRYAIRLGSANATSVVEYIGAKEGILTRGRFETEQRWKNFDVSIQGL